MTAPTFGSLFSGIGGLDLGLERAGWSFLWQAETDPYCSDVLARHWPDVPNLGDVTKIGWSNVERPDLICGGYPCQPFSSAGGRGGDTDSRHLWPHMRDAVRVLRPRFVLIENVAGHLSLGFDVVLADLAALGFDAEWSLVSASALGAPHQRRRLFVLAYAAGTERRATQPQGMATAGQRTTEPRERGCSSSPGGYWWPVEPDVGRVADGVPARVDRLRGLGNAVVPQVAEWVGRRLLEATK